MKETKRTIKVSEHIRLDTRPGSAKWQARVKLADGSWHRFSTKTESIERATEVAMKFFYTSEDRLKNNLPQSTRKFHGCIDFVFSSTCATFGDQDMSMSAIWGMRIFWG